MKKIITQVSVLLLGIPATGLAQQWTPVSTLGNTELATGHTSVAGNPSVYSKALRIGFNATNDYVQVGPNTTDFANFLCATPRLFMDKPLHAATVSGIGTFSSYGTADFVLGTGKNINNITADQWMIVKNSNGNVGIGDVDLGFNNPLYKLHVDGDVFLAGTATGNLFLGDNNTQAQWGAEYSNGGLNIWKPWGSNNPGNYYVFLKDNGNVGIGTDNATAKLTVNGKMLIGDPATVNIATQGTYNLYVAGGILSDGKVRVALKNSSAWPDYVFSDEYCLAAPSELEAFIKEHKHLPGIPSADDVVKNGVDLLEMSSMLLEKVEELTLHVAEMNRNDEARCAELDKQQLQLGKLTQEMEASHQ